MFKESPLSTLIHFPLSHISTSVYDTSVDWINKLPFLSLRAFLLWACKSLADVKPIYQPVALLIGLAMILRSKPAALTAVLPKLRDRPIYQGLDKLPLLVWMMAQWQASQGDLSAGLYSWAHNLLPLVGNDECCTPRSLDLILQFVEIILSNPEARTILVNRAVREGEPLIPPSSFEILVRLTFPPSSARVKATKRFEKVYPLLKEVALAPETATEGNAVEQIFTFSLKLAGEGNSGLAKEAAAIAMWSVTENVDCFKHWDILYKEHLEASVALLRKLVDEWKVHSPKLSSSPGDFITVNQTMNSFRLKNEKAITEGGANCSLYKEAEKSCKLISRRLLSRESGGLEITHITCVVLATAVAAAGGVAGAALALCSH
ncbi:Transmembrane protein 214 [Arabidopsis suecica]|uniref:Transmembrane protein 214 n=2 Tax=Arabidopsis suecica TaxID=45249 RepID=A0A8T1XC45_ARASU|nr:Transmembrane protein 214 [Arabidopsis suecica]